LETKGQQLAQEGSPAGKTEIRWDNFEEVNLHPGGCAALPSSLCALAVQRLSQLICEGNALEVDACETMHALRCAVWRLVVSRLVRKHSVLASRPFWADSKGGKGEQKGEQKNKGNKGKVLYRPTVLRHWSRLIGCFDLDWDLLTAMIEGGRALGLGLSNQHHHHPHSHHGTCLEFRWLVEARKRTRAALNAAATARFDSKELKQLAFDLLLPLDLCLREEVVVDR
jgi:hypothetical protein